MTEATPGRGEAEDESGWPTYETSVAFQWLSNSEPLYLQARGLVERSGGFHAGADALEEWVLEENPLGEAEPSLYTALLAQAIAGIAWDDLAEAFAPDDWTEPKTS